jgi:hypothetical protein
MDMKSTNFNEEDQEVLKKVAESYAEEVLLHTDFFQDPFELYAETLKAKFYINPVHFTSRFVDGYQVLLQELETLSVIEKKRHDSKTN